MILKIIQSELFYFKLDALVKKLTPDGQKTATQIMIDLQAISFAGIQPVFQYVAKEFNTTIQQIKSSNDSSKLDQLLKLYGVGNSSAGLGGLRDDCQDAKNIAAVVATMSPVGQNATLLVLDEIERGFVTILPVVLSINRLLDDSLYKKLMASENATTLAALAALYQD